MSTSCVAKKGGFTETLCRTLTFALDNRPLLRKNLRGIYAEDMGDMGVRVTLHSGDYSGKFGAVMSHCPFCGERLNDIEPIR